MNLQTLQQYKPQILALAEAHGVANIRVFGSVARGDASPESDVDFLVTVARPTGWDFFGLEPALEKLLGTKVDVVTDSGIRAPFKNSILKDAVLL